MDERDLNQIPSKIRGVCIPLMLGWATMALLGPGCGEAGCPTAREMSDTFAAVASTVMPAVVAIRVEKTVEMTLPDVGDPSGGGQPGASPDRPRKRPSADLVPSAQRGAKRFIQRGQGSGFIVASDGYILTNHHVVDGAERITVELKDGRKISNVKVIGSDSESEIALIKVDANSLPTVSKGDSDRIAVGDWVMAIGNPFGLHETVTVGIISAVGRSNVHVASYEDFIQTDAAMNPGNSGGPLVDLDGKVIGINTAIVSESGGYMGIGFAIPINMAYSIQEQLRQYGRMVRGYLGLSGQDLTEDMATLLRVKERGGVIIASVEKGSPAAKAGLGPRDVILTMDGKRVESYYSLRNETALLKPGTRISLKVFKDGGTRDVDVTLVERPVEKGVVQPKLRSEEKTDLGLEVRNLTRELADQLGYATGEGVIVVAVSPDGTAAAAGLTPGDLILSIDQEPTNSMEAFEKALKPGKEAKSLFLIRRGTSSQFVVVRVPASS
jgi:serine protease Do